MVEIKVLTNMKTSFNCVSKPMLVIYRAREWLVTIGVAARTDIRQLLL